MAAPTPALSFDEMIQADRKKRKAEALAQSIFGNKKGAALGVAKTRGGAASPAAGGLAARVGVQKRTNSTGSAHTLRRDLLTGNTISRPSSAHPLSRRGPRTPATRPHAPLRASTSAIPTVTSTTPAPVAAPNPPSFSIRGAASLNTTGPFVVIASNFAPGTTAADIKSSLEVSVGSEILACKLLSLRPSVVCEIVFKEREGAEAVVGLYHGNYADGRLLNVYIKNGPPTQDISFISNNTTPQSQSQSAPSSRTSAITKPTTQPAQAQPQAPIPVAEPQLPIEDEIMDLDDTLPTNNTDQQIYYEDTTRAPTPPHVQQIPVVQSTSHTSSRPNRDEGRLNRDNDSRGYSRGNGGVLGESRYGNGERSGGGGYQDGRYGYRDDGGRRYDGYGGGGGRRGGYGGGGYGGGGGGGYRNGYGRR